jgi:hypothetical protein
VALTVWNVLKLSEFWSNRLPPSREGTRWLNVLMTLVIYRLIDPGSEWRLHRQCYERSALGDLLGEDFGLAAKDNLYRCLDIQWPQESQEVNATTFTFGLALDRYRLWYRREGRYLLRTNLTETDPKPLWEYYLQLVALEAAFKNLKDDLQIRPIFHQKEQRIEAHIFVAYLAYCLHVTLQAKLRQVAGGLTPRGLLEKFATMQMMDVFFPTEEPGRELLFRRYTQPEKDHQILLAQLGWQLPEQPPPRISVRGQLLD